MVYVLNSIGKPLMPCSNSKARKLLKAGKAKIVRRDIFTIQLLYRSNNYRQETTLGIDAGSKHIGFSVTTNNLEFISGTAKLRERIVRLISDRKALRSGRRHRKTRYRKERFSNRVANKKNGWLPPSIQQKIDSHVRLALLISEILPINRIIVEVAAFDICKIKNPDINGKEYLQGELYGFYNIREYVFYRDNHTCQYCKGKSKDSVLQIHHIESRKTGGNAPNNLITLCKTCHEAYHKGLINIGAKRGKPFRDATEMSIMRWRIINGLKKYFANVEHTYGHITKHNRIELGLPKEHYNDAFCITKNFNAQKLDKHYIIRFIARHSRILHIQKPSKGGKRRSMKAPYWLKNSYFTRYDKVLFNKQECFISARECGYATLRDINWNQIKRAASVKKLKLITRHHGSMLVAQDK